MNPYVALTACACLAGWVRALYVRLETERQRTRIERTRFLAAHDHATKLEADLAELTADLEFALTSWVAGVTERCN